MPAHLGSRLENLPKQPVAELLDDALARAPAKLNEKLIAEELQRYPRLKSSVLLTNRFRERLGIIEKLIGNRMDDVVAKNFMKLYHDKLLFNAGGEGAEAFDKFEEFLVAINTHFPSAERPLLDQLKGNPAPVQRLETFLKGNSPFSPWLAGFETIDSFGDSSRGLLIQLYESIHGKYSTGYKCLDVMENGKVIREPGLDFQRLTEQTHFVQMTTTASHEVSWLTKLEDAVIAAKTRGGTKLTFDVYWLADNGKPVVKLEELVTKA